MGHIEKVITTEHEHGVECTNGHSYFWKMTDEAICLLGTPCREHVTHDHGETWTRCNAEIVEYERDMEFVHDEYVCSCGSHNADRRYVWGIYYDIMCDPCWKKSGMEERDREGFDPDYCGESLEEVW
jgi:hypothetical protein